MFDIESLKFTPDGLIPAIVQDHHTGQVLMMAWMNRESLAISLAERRTCFWSRSRGELWRKGATSGNIQRITFIAADCDGDALLVRVIPAGPACHTGETSCFFQPVWQDDAHPPFSLDGLYGLLEGRKALPQEGSYTSYLFEKGTDKILKKVGEEATEVVVAAKNNDKAELTCELADLCYHALVLMLDRDIGLADVRAELGKRHVVDKKVKQEYLGGQADA